MTTVAMTGAQLAVIHSRLDGIVRKMANTLLRTGRSGVLNRAKDFSCCIVTADCELLAAADSLPIHVLSGPDLMARAMLDFHPELQPGDAFLHNSPYHGCSHAADHTILIPVIDAQGVHQLTVLAKAHQADIGNSIPTTYHGMARDVYEEGALLFPAVQVQRGYADIEDIMRMCQLRIRVPSQWSGDYRAMVGAGRIGEAECLALGKAIGWNRIRDFARQWFDYSETRMAEAISRLPSGMVAGASTHDAFPGMPPQGITVRAQVRVDAVAGRIDVDLRDNPDCLPCGMNLSESTARTAAMIGVFNSVDPDVPKNAGSFRRITVQLRRGCIAGIPEHPYSCSAATTNIADRVANSVQTALAGLGEGVGMAEVGAVIPPSDGVISGTDPRTGRPFVNQVFLAFSGGAGTPFSDSWWTTAHVGNGGMCCLDGIELAELYQPILVRSRAFVGDSEGAGRFTGAPGTIVEFGPLGCEIDVAYGSDGGANPAAGVRGGGAGGCASQQLRRVDGVFEPLPNCAQVRVRPGERIVAVSAGGGGYGDPQQRDPLAVATDVREGLVSAGRARAVYQVVIAADGTVDWGSTSLLRTTPGRLEEGA